MASIDGTVVLVPDVPTSPLVVATAEVIALSTAEHVWRHAVA